LRPIGEVVPEDEVADVAMVSAVGAIDRTSNRIMPIVAIVTVEYNEDVDFGVLV
jgi:hypothetical protein